MLTPSEALTAMAWVFLGLGSLCYVFALLCWASR